VAAGGGLADAHAERERFALALRDGDAEHVAERERDELAVRDRLALGRHGFR
jgi:hypothetical protein